MTGYRYRHVTAFLLLEDRAFTGGVPPGKPLGR